MDRFEMKTSAYRAMDKLFYPKSVAVVGASSNFNNLGSRHLKLIQKFGYTGKLFAVNPRAEACHAVPGYKRITHIPDPVDLCFIAVVEVVG